MPRSRPFGALPLFQRRHYEWLAEFAGCVLDEQQWGLLATRLAEADPNFKTERFLDACDKARIRDRETFLDRYREDGDYSMSPVF